MFEHLKMTKQLKQQLSKVLSIALSVAMLVGTIPADMLGGIASVKAAAAGTLSAEDFTADTTDITDTNGVYTVSGVTVKEEGSSKYFEVTASSSITFSVATGKKGTLNVTADNSEKLTLDGEVFSTSVTSGSHTVSASTGETVKLTSITLTLADDTPNPDPGTNDPVTVSVTVTGQDLLAENDTITFTPAEEGTPLTLTKTSDGIGGDVQLKKGIEYTISCSNTNVKATTKSGETDTDKVTVSAAGNLTINLAPKTVKATVSITDADSLISATSQLKLICAETGTTERDQNLTNDAEVTLTVGNKYKIDPDSVPAGAKAELDGADEDGTITAEATTTSLAVTVTADDSATVAATITLDKTNAVIAEDSTAAITLTNAADTNDTKTINVTEDSTVAYTMKQGATYNITTSDPAIRATVSADRVSTVTAAAAITIDLATQAEATVEFTGDALPTGVAVKAANTKVTADVVTLSGLTTGTKAPLWIGDTYDLISDPANKVTAKIGEETSLTVTKATNAISVAITVNEAEDDVVVLPGAHVLDMDTELAGSAKDTTFKTGTADKLKFLGKNDTETNTYTSADGYFKLHYKDGSKIASKAQTFDGVTKTLGVNMQGKLNSVTSDADGKVTVNAEAYYEFAVSANSDKPAKLTVYWYGGGSSGTRDIWLLNSKGQEVSGNNTTTEGSSTMMISDFTITEKGTYYLGCKSNGCVFCYIEVAEPAILDMDTELAGSAKDTTFKTGTADKLKFLGKNDTETNTYTSADGYFKLHYKDGSKIASKAQTFDGVTKTLGVNMQGKLNSVTSDNDGNVTVNAEAYYEFTVNDAEETKPAKLTVYWYGGGSSGTRDIWLLNSKGQEVSGNNTTTEGSSTMMISDFTITEKGTYYLGCKSNGCVLCYIEVDEHYVPDNVETERGNWDTDVAAPEITDVKYENGKVTVTAKGVIDSKGKGADYIALEVYNKIHIEDETITELVAVNRNSKDNKGHIEPNSTANTKGEHLTTLEYTPSASGTYAFKAVLCRDDEKDENGNVTATYTAKKSDYGRDAAGDIKYVTYKVPLTQPEITSKMNLDAETEETEEGEHKTGGITVAWNAVKEADYYRLYVKKADQPYAGENDSNVIKFAQTKATSVEVRGLELDQTVYFTVIAYRENSGDEAPDASPESATDSLKITGKQPYAYLFDAGDYESGKSLAAGTKHGTNDYYTLMFLNKDGSASVKNASTGNYIEINKYGSTGMQFKVYGTASASFAVASTGGSNESPFGLVDSKGKLVDGKITGAGCSTEASKVNENDSENKGTAYIAKGTAISTIEYTELPAGTYTFLSPYTEGRNRGGRIHRMAVYDSDPMPDREEWNADNVGTPEISKITYTKGDSEIKVTASGYVGFDGADSLKVEMLDSNGVVAASVVKADESTFDEDGKRKDVDMEFAFKPKASGDYSFRASLVRGAETDIKMEDAPASWTVEGFVLPLAAPAIVSTTNKAATGTTGNGNPEEPSADPEGSLEVSFTGVDEADYYVVAAFLNTDKIVDYFDIEAYENAESAPKIKLAEKKVLKNAENEYTETLDGLPLGECYITVQAFRDTKSSKLNLKATTTTIAKENKTDEEGAVSASIETKVMDGFVLEALKLKADKETLTDDELQALKKKATNPTDEVLAEVDEFIASLNDDAAKKAKFDTALEKANITNERNAVKVVRSKPHTSSDPKYVNGKADLKWAYAAYGTSTTLDTYDRPAGLNTFDGEYKSGDKEYNSDGSATIPQNGYKEIVSKTGDNKGDLESVTVWSENGKGKDTESSTDGLSYYYTAIDPSKKNFTLSALIHVTSWQFSIGQDAFGMMVSDAVGKNGDGDDFWTNSYQLVATKLQYTWVRATDEEPGYVSSAAADGVTSMRYTMNLGVGWRTKVGTTAADVAKIKAGTINKPDNFKITDSVLEHSAGDRDNGKGLFSGTYNVIGNGYNKAQIAKSSVDDDSKLLTDFRFQIQKYDNAYSLRYLETVGMSEDAKNAIENKETEDDIPEAERTKFVCIGSTWYKVLGEQVFADDDNNNMTQVDRDNLYVGFFASRNARISVKEIDLQTPDFGQGDKYDTPPTYVDPAVIITSSENSGSDKYELMLNANFDGTLTIYSEELDDDGKVKDGTKKAVVTSKAITAGANNTFITKLSVGKTQFTYYAKPSETYVPGENQKLSSTKMQTNEKNPHIVTYNEFSGTEIYVAPNGKTVGTPYTTTEVDGKNVYSNYAGSSKDYPTNIYDAIDYVKAGQTIILAGGVYDLKTDKYYSELGEDGKTLARNIVIGRGHDGTPKAPIIMKAADGAVDDGTTNNRPILDFGQNTTKRDSAFTIAGNYWRFEGFDVMSSMNGQKGVALAGSYNILRDMRTYLNGDTGIQVSKTGNVGRDEWPSYNTVINCSSFMNYDSGYGNADGFAAKLTCGDGNKFIGCISAYNADDGWDLFAKADSGPIGKVTIENCIAFKNGYLFGEEGYYGAGSDLIYRYIDYHKYQKKSSIVDAGDGNGFKMGGESISGYHTIKNSISFGNKAKGIDSNSCPDIQIYNCISFNNEGSNVAIYTSAAVNTDYYAENVISFKDSDCSAFGTADNIKPLGTQNPNKINDLSNFYWSGSKSANISFGDNFRVNYNGAVYKTDNAFEHTSMDDAIFGSTAHAPIGRKADGSIDLNGFLVKKDGGGVIEDTDPETTLDNGRDIYVFAADYCKGNSKLADIKLNAYEATKELAANGYNWVDGDTIATSVYAGLAVDFKVKKETDLKTVTVNFIQLDGAELQIIDGDKDKDGVLDATEKWTVEAVPVISPAVEPDVELTGFSAEIKETTKLLKNFTPATGNVNKNLKVQNASVTAERKADAANGDAKMTATVSLTAGGRTVKKTATLTFAVSNGNGIKFTSVTTSDNSLITWNNENGADSDYIEVSDKVDTFTMNNLHFYKTVADSENEGKYKEEVLDFGKGVTVKVNDTSVIKTKGNPQTTSDGKGVDVTFEVVNRSGDGGTATVTVTSKDDKSLVRKYIVTVSGSEFAWNAGMVTIDKAKTDGIQLTALAPFGQSLKNIVTKKTVTTPGVEGGSDTTTTVALEANELITVSKVYKGAKVVPGREVNDYNKFFDATHVSGTDGVYELNTTVSAAGTKSGNGITGGLPKGTYTVVYKTKVTETVAATDAEGNASTNTEEKTYDFTPITIMVTETRPAVTFKQTKKVNLFYKNGTTGSTGKLTATSKQGGVTITEISNANNSTAKSYYDIRDRGPGNYDIACINSQAVKLNDRGTAVDYADARRNTRLVLQAHVDGYHDIYDVYTWRNFSVAVEYRQPRLKLTALDKTIYKTIGMNSVDVLIYDPDAEQYLNTGNATITLETDRTKGKAYSAANAYFTVGAIKSAENRVKGVKLTMKDDNARGGAVKLSINNSEWFDKDPVIVSQSIQINNTNPRVTIRPVKLNMNTEKFVGNEQAISPILVTGAAGYDITITKVEGANVSSKKLEPFLEWEQDKDINGNNILKVSLKKDQNDKFPATANNRGVYKMDSGYAAGNSFTVSYKLGNTADVNTTNFSLSLVSNERLTVATKGAIDIIDRKSSTVTLKPRMTNFTPLRVTDVTLTGDSAGLFMVTNFDRTTGEATIQAKETVSLNAGSYKVTPVYTFDLGVMGTADMQTERPIVIKTKQSGLKISGLKDALEVKLSSTKTAAQRTITVSPANAKITELTQTSGLKNFTLTYTGDGVEVEINNRADLKEGQTYRITALITVEGGSSTVRKQVITVPVKVIR